LCSSVLRSTSTSENLWEMRWASRTGIVVPSLLLMCGFLVSMDALPWPHHAWIVSNQGIAALHSHTRHSCPTLKACSFGWACSLLVREEVLLAGLVWEKNTVPAENLRSFTTSTSQPNTSTSPHSFLSFSGFAGILYIGRDFDCWWTSGIKQEIGATSSNYTGSLYLLNSEAIWVV